MEIKYFPSSMKILQAHCHGVILSHSGTLYVYTIISMHSAHNQECHFKVGALAKNWSGVQKISSLQTL